MKGRKEEVVLGKWDLCVPWKIGTDETASPIPIRVKSSWNGEGEARGLDPRESGDGQVEPTRLVDRGTRGSLYPVILRGYGGM